MWLQTESLALAHLRFGGEYRIVSQDIDYDVSHPLAVNTHPQSRHRRPSAIMATSMR
jgi:hypothetical protein